MTGFRSTRHAASSTKFVRQDEESHVSHRSHVTEQLLNRNFLRFCQFPSFSHNASEVVLSTPRSRRFHRLVDQLSGRPRISCSCSAGVEQSATTDQGTEQSLLANQPLVLCQDCIVFTSPSTSSKLDTILIQ